MDEQTKCLCGTYYLTATQGRGASVSFHCPQHGQMTIDDRQFPIVKHMREESDRSSEDMLRMLVEALERGNPDDYGYDAMRALEKAKIFLK